MFRPALSCGSKLVQCIRVLRYDPSNVSIQKQRGLGEATVQGSARRCSCWVRLLPPVLALLVTLGQGLAFAQGSSPTDCQGVLPLDLRQICERSELRVVRYGGERPPFFFRQDDEWVGFDIDLGRDMAERLGVRYRETAADSFDDVVDRVASGAADIGLSKLSGTLERAKRVRFSEPYLTVYQALLVHRLSEPAGGEPFQALNDTRFTIGALGGTAYVGYVHDSLSNSEARSYSDFEEMMNDVVAGTIDAALMDSARADRWRRDHREQLIHVRTTIDRSRSDPLAIAVGWENTHLLAWINLYLERIRADGTAEHLYQKWFGTQ